MAPNNNIDNKALIARKGTSIIFAFGIIALTVGCWNEITWYEFTAPLGTLVSFFILASMFFCCVDIRKALKDPALWLMGAADVLALIHLFVIHSNKGAILTVVDVLLVLYLADKIVLDRKIMLGLCIYVGIYFYYWTIDVKGYFKGYNTNYGGLVLITGFVFSVGLLIFLKDILAKKGKITASRLMYIPILFMFAWGYNIIAWYRARCALLGLIVYAVIMIIPKKVWSIKWLYNLLTLSMTVGAVLISGIYVLLGQLKDVFTIRIFYKDIISGREEIWSELWGAFLKKPITGIGSSYEMQLDWMGGMFEVHSGLLDILFVHGTVVFAVVIAFLIKRLMEIRSAVVISNNAKSAMAGIMAVLASSFLENFFIVPPFLLCFLLMFCVVNDVNNRIFDK